MVTQVAGLLVGAALLLLGRQLYWLFVVGVGFAAAMQLVPRFVQSESTLTVLVIALAAGLIGALIAVFLQRAAIGIAGFLAGAYVVLTLLEVVGVQSAVLSWVLAFIGGFVGVALTQMVFEWALILLSSITGAAMIAQGLNVARPVTVIAFLILLVVGAALQASMMGRRGAKTR